MQQFPVVHKSRVWNKQIYVDIGTEMKYYFEDTIGAVSETLHRKLKIE